MSEQQCVFRGENQGLDSIVQVNCLRKTSKFVQGKVLLGHILSVSVETLASFTSNEMNSKVCGFQFGKLVWFVPKNRFLCFLCFSAG
jgi:hypothetical protein